MGHALQFKGPIFDFNPVASNYTCCSVHHLNMSFELHIKSDASSLVGEWTWNTPDIVDNLAGPEADIESTTDEFEIAYGLIGSICALIVKVRNLALWKKRAIFISSNPFIACSSFN